jgi:hypothetical protein
MRIINTSTVGHFKFSIDQHTMTVQAADFTAVQPYNQIVLDIAIGISFLRRVFEILRSTIRCDFRGKSRSWKLLDESCAWDRLLTQ